MKNVGKNPTEVESYSVSEAAAVLGVSSPTVKRMVAEGRVKAYHTPGGHLRIHTESLNAMREGETLSRRSAGDVSPALQNRREHLEELSLELREHRINRELEKVRDEKQAEEDRRRAQEEARQQEAAQRQQEIELERQRLAQEKAEERRQREAEQELAAFRSRWLRAAIELVSDRRYAWLTPTQRKEVLEALEAAIESRQPTEDHDYMGSVIVQSFLAALQPFEAERKAQERRQRLTEQALWRLPGSATEVERAAAMTAVREALKSFGATADECEMRIAAQQAIEPIARAIEKRLLDQRVINWAIFKLSWSATDYDKARVRRECAEILTELPNDLTENEAREALGPTIQEACDEIRQRQAEKDRQARRTPLIQQGVAFVSSYLRELKRQGEITPREYFDSGFTGQLQEAVRRSLEADLSGNETAQEVQKKARAIIDGCLE